MVIRRRGRIRRGFGVIDRSHRIVARIPVGTSGVVAVVGVATWGKEGVCG